MTITTNMIDAFIHKLIDEEREISTIDKYLRDVNRFAEWLGSGDLTHESCLKWKEKLMIQKLNPSTINGMLSALNKFLSVVGREDCKIKKLRVQRRVFRSIDRELTKDEYFKLIQTAQNKGKERISLLMETICATGIRVSEVKAITIDAIDRGRAEIYLKGKVRTILLPNKLCRKLKKYAKKQKIASGEIFLTRSGKSISRKQIWAEMKAICKLAGVSTSKVFPHNLRHLFARAFYKVCRDIVKLADVLGHSSVETTRIYLVSSGYEHSRNLERLGLLC